ncbi:MAG: glycoside hydrolase family 1 protein, partial [Anaerolineales bacterium]|nr:glycoside hydrolase family 1 protein [Anaerolineales bacterium]
MAQGTMIFPPDFRWGTATASFQVEGHTTNSDWWAWEQEPGRILHNQRSGQACNWWEDAEADLDRAAALGNNAHRLSVEWSRIEPEPSVFDKEALNRYREILQAMIARGLEPMVTLHHFSNPLWLAEKGDFTSGLVVDYFRRYVAQVVAALGDLVSKWITINEPMVYVYMRHMRGVYPATATGYGTAFRVIRNLLRSHAAAYHAIKEGQPAAQVGIAKYVPVMQNRPGSNFLSTPWRRWLNYLFNDLWLNGMVSGRFAFPLGRQSIPHLNN